VKVKPLHAMLARRALRLDSMAAPDPPSLGVLTPTISSALSSLPASLSSSNDFETGSNQAGSDAAWRRQVAGRNRAQSGKAVNRSVHNMGLTVNGVHLLKNLVLAARQRVILPGVSQWPLA
jgi:hypothetical protein